MEAVMAEPPEDMSGHVLCLAELGRVQERVVVIFHAALPNARDVHLYSVHLELLKLRRSRLMGHIRASLELSTCGTPQALEHAFTKMNDELRDVVGTSDCWNWCAQNRSLVVVLGDAHVYVFGEALASVMLCRSGKDERLTRPSSLHRLKNASPPQSSSLPFYYHKERLTTADSYLIVTSRHLERHMDSDYTSVFTTRIDALGLEEACRQIAGTGTDECRTFAVVAVGELLRQKVANGVTQEVSGQLHSAAEDKEEGPIEIFPDPAEESVSEDENEYENEFEDEFEEFQDEDELYGVIPHGLRPLDNGNPQLPEPVTSCEPRPRRDPCIRVMDLKEEDLKLVCKVGSCKFVIKSGDISEWFVDGKNDAIVIPVEGQIHREICYATGSFTGLDIIPSAGLPASKIIITQGLKYSKVRETEAVEHLGRTYRDAISFACGEGVKHIALPAISCGHGGFPLDKAAWIAVESVQKALKSAKVSIEVHFVIKDEPTWRAWVAATDLLAFKDYDGYVSCWSTRPPFSFTS
ncbi:hypothetical protein SELMODRAFT_405952 [Selaginella moellendorffii]|uniref:Macro domain-containing protein n=1 Tax=Selaginella moellendorffii TaxID=88036 RepID=D8R068_SELML|nr:hypothetical protein SELMODRAFT_405952 [Selaginella moellendorffii]